MAEECLSSNHARRLLVTCRYIDKLLADMEGALAVEQSRKAFPEYSSDITPGQRQIIEESIAKIRAQLKGVLDGLGIDHPAPSIPVSRYLHTVLTFIAIAAEELRPKYMRGYGEVSSEAAGELNAIATTLLALSTQLDRYITTNVGQAL
ncbi:MAG TPA: hypothetical protein VMX38_11665 [Verrucomicrobiae bacterium]|jgi:hypothetical protein|nr:hypothetical protein [Verrucomicrobiae bacterium]